MKIQILFADPAERRFGSGDVFTAKELAAIGIDGAALLAAGDAQEVAEKTEQPEVNPMIAQLRAQAREEAAAAVTAAKTVG